MNDDETLRQRLAEAEQALHEVELGQSTTALRDASGRQVTFTPADAVRLRAYIASLKQQLGFGGRPAARPVYF